MLNRSSGSRSNAPGSFKVMTLACVLVITLIASLIPCLEAHAQSDRWLVNLKGDYPQDITITREERVVWGTLPSLPWTGEVVVDEHVLINSDTFPLPVYPSDLAPAEEDEIFWTVSLEVLQTGTDDYEIYDYIESSFSGRTISVSTPPGGFGLNVSMHVTVYAFRTGSSSRADASSFGEVKELFQ